MNHNIIIYKSDLDTNYKDFDGKTSNKYIYNIEDIKRIIKKKSKIIIRGFYNPINNTKEEATEYKDLYQITKYEEQSREYNITKSAIQLVNIFTGEIKTCDLRLRREIKRIGAGYCPHYTQVLCGLFPVIEEITNEKENTYNGIYYDNKLLLYDNISFNERLIDLTNFDVNIKKQLEETEEELLITTQSYYSSNDKTQVLEIITNIQKVIIE